MRDPDRIKPILRQVYRIWRRHPDLRLLQLLLNAAKTETHGRPTPLAFFFEDDELTTQLDQLLAKDPIDSLADLVDDADQIFIKP